MKYAYKKKKKYKVLYIYIIKNITYKIFFERNNTFRMYIYNKTRINTYEKILILIMFLFLLLVYWKFYIIITFLLNNKQITWYRITEHLSAKKFKPIYNNTYN